MESDTKHTHTHTHKVKMEARVRRKIFYGVEANELVETPRKYALNKTSCRDF